MEETICQNYLHKNLIIKSDKQNSAQGSVFYCKKTDDPDPSKELILKVYKIEDMKSYIKEMTVMKKLQDEKNKFKNNQENLERMVGFPTPLSFLEGQKSSEILMEALGPNLRKLLRECPKSKFSKTTVYMMTIQLIQRIQIMHELGYIHNDLKLENIIIGHKDPSVIYLIDFGLSCKYLNEDASHNAKEFINKFSGNFMFASLNSCRGNTKSRRDDIQSILYIMIYLLNKNSLPWDKFHKKFQKQKYEFKDFLLERLQIKYSQEVYRMMPLELRPIFKEVFTLKYEQEPPYKKIIDAIQQEIQKNIVLDEDNKPIEHVFEWAKNHTSQVKAQILQTEQKQLLSDQGSGEASRSRSANNSIMRNQYRSKPMDLRVESNQPSQQQSQLGSNVFKLRTDGSGSNQSSFQGGKYFSNTNSQNDSKNYGSMNLEEEKIDKSSFGKIANRCSTPNSQGYKLSQFANNDGIPDSSGSIGSNNNFPINKQLSEQNLNDTPRSNSNNGNRGISFFGQNAIKQKIKKSQFFANNNYTLKNQSGHGQDMFRPSNEASNNSYQNINNNFQKLFSNHQNSQNSSSQHPSSIKNNEQNSGFNKLKPGNQQSDKNSNLINRSNKYSSFKDQQSDKQAISLKDNEESSSSSNSINKSGKRLKSGSSDYIDENFEFDETDELWGLNKLNYDNLKQLQPHDNDIQKIDKKCSELKK